MHTRADDIGAARGNRGGKTCEETGAVARINENFRNALRFADARRDNGISRTLQVSQVPAVYLAQPFTGVITPIGFGVLSEAQLVERIAIVGAAPAIGTPTLAGKQAVVNREAP